MYIYIYIYIYICIAFAADGLLLFIRIASSALAQQATYLPYSTPL